MAWPFVTGKFSQFRRRGGGEAMKKYRSPRTTRSLLIRMQLPKPRVSVREITRNPFYCLQYLHGVTTTKKFVAVTRHPIFCIQVFL